jgi:hypothetical protein
VEFELAQVKDSAWTSSKEPTCVRHDGSTVASNASPRHNANAGEEKLRPHDGKMYPQEKPLEITVTNCRTPAERMEPDDPSAA